MIDTENRSGSLYAGMDIGGTHIGEFLTVDLDPPFSPQRYMEAIEAAEQAGVEFMVVDSLSHAWSGEGGMLDMQGAIAKRSGNSYTAWRDITPQHNRLIDKLLQCDMHVVIAMRTKTEYVVEDNGQGKKAPRKIGTAPVFRDGIEYEVTTFFDLAQDHTAATTKDRTGLFDGQIFRISTATGALLQSWLAGAEPEPRQGRADKPSEPAQPTLAERVDAHMRGHCEGMTKEQKEAVAAQIKEITGGTANYRAVTDEAVLLSILKKFGGDEVC